MNPDFFKNYVLYKTHRQSKLEERKKYLEALSSDLKASTFKRSFNSLFYISKRILFILTGVLLLTISIILFAFPEIVFNNNNLKKEMIQETKNNYYKTFGESLSQSFTKAITSESSIERENILKTTINNFDQSMESVIEEEILDEMKFMAFLILGLSLFILYIARQAHKIHHRNKLITEKERMLKSIIEDYSNSISEDAEELNSFNQLLKEVTN